MTKQKTRSNLSVQYMTRIAILGALSAVLFPLEIPIVAFYKLDFSTLPALLGAFSMGPLPGLAILLIKDLSRLAYSSCSYLVIKNYTLRFVPCQAICPCFLRFLQQFSLTKNIVVRLSFRVELFSRRTAKRLSHSQLCRSSSRASMDSTSFTLFLSFAECGNPAVYHATCFRISRIPVYSPRYCSCSFA